MPVSKKERESVTGGTINLDSGSLIIQATRVGSDTYLAQIIKVCFDLLTF
jgi:cation transport ATPase